MKKVIVALLPGVLFFATSIYAETALFTWVSGDDTIDNRGIYGTKGVADPNNIPGARAFSISWADGAGDLWLFGGGGYGSAGNSGYLNDLWKYDTSSGLWTWISGASTTDSIGVYGTKGVANPNNIPGARSGSISWMDADGSLWLFGGEESFLDNLNDLWKYDHYSGLWTWVSGASTADNVGVYGTKGVPDAANIPRARSYSISWTDADGNLWLFGGLSYRSGVFHSYLNDLWKYDVSTGEWTWVSGSNSIYPSIGVYGTKGVADPNNIPGARAASISWTDADGSLWLFGGVAGDRGYWGHFNDLWKYDPYSGLWTWVSGDSTINSIGIYGTKGLADPNNIPGARAASISWTDGNGDLWLFGGDYYDSMGTPGRLNDLWKYEISSGLWTWVSGDSIGDQSGVYGTRGVTDAANMPGARVAGISWTDTNGDLWLFGGSGYDNAGYTGTLNDLWRIKLIAEIVDFDEFALLAAHWMKTGCTEGTDCVRADWHIDGSIDLLDLQELAAKWLEEE